MYGLNVLSSNSKSHTGVLFRIIYSVPQQGVFDAVRSML